MGGQTEGSTAFSERPTANNRRLKADGFFWSPEIPRHDHESNRNEVQFTRCGGPLLPSRPRSLAPSRPPPHAPQFNFPT